MMVDRLAQEVLQTYTSVENNKWLVGARLIYETVRSLRYLNFRETKAYSEWLGIKQDIDRLEADLTLQNIPMPNISDFEMPLPPKTSGEFMNHNAKLGTCK